MTPNKEAFAQAFIKELPGLNIDVARAWVQREVGAYNNLGIMDSPGNPHQFATPQQGAKAAADLIKRSNNYAGIRTSLQGTPAQQALAIAQSPWRLGPSGLRAQGGTDPYYYKGFVQAGILSGNTSIPSGGASTPITPQNATTLPNANTVEDSKTTLDKILGLPADMSIDATTVKQIQDKIDSLLTAGTITTEVAAGLRESVGGAGVAASHGTKSILGDITINTSTGRDPGIELPNIDIPGALMFVAVILIGITFLILGGIIVLRKK